jgi:hypothetical protein
VTAEGGDWMDPAELEALLSGDASTAGATTGPSATPSDPTTLP